MAVPSAAARMPMAMGAMMPDPKELAAGLPEELRAMLPADMPVDLTAMLGPLLGMAKQMGASVYEIPPGQALCPYHYEYAEEEWLLVLEGEATVRHPGGEEKLGPWDLTCFPPGPEGAHEVRGKTVGIIVSDSFGRAWRVGPTRAVLGLAARSRRALGRGCAGRHGWSSAARPRDPWLP